MSEFAVSALCLDNVIEHPNAERLELAIVGGYQSCVPKGKFIKGQLVIYIPEAAVLPDELMEVEGLVGLLKGPKKNRVKAIKLRGILSQGIVIDAEPYLPYEVYMGVMESGNADDISDMSEKLGITKYEPHIPNHMGGSAKQGAMFGWTKGYDFENIKKHPNMLRDDDYVFLTEKLHGTYIQIGWCRDLEPSEDRFGDGRVFVTSKGLAKRGVVIVNDPANETNLYVKAAQVNGLFDKIVKLAENVEADRIYIMGEVFGCVQDLHYGMKDGEVQMNIFDCYGQDEDGKGEYAPTEVLSDIADSLGVKMVPIIAQGEWGDIQPRLEEYTRGMSTFDPKQIREGVVIRTRDERIDPRYGRVIVKSVSEDYLLRKGEVSEFA